MSCNCKVVGSNDTPTYEREMRLKRGHNEAQMRPKSPIDVGDEVVLVKRSYCFHLDRRRAEEDVLSVVAMPVKDRGTED